ncbi:MAG: hypothetical protein MEQ07_03270 [Aquimonas sp.]|nr:hypothetical protein [Aquimonas sp.]
MHHRTLRLALAGLALCLGASAQASTCGRISTFDIAPRTENLFAAVLIAVNGNLPGPTTADQWRLPPGRHTLTVAEAIDANRFLASQNRERDGRRTRDRYKTLVVEVEPGITYRLAARLIPEGRSLVRRNAHWEPVIWKQSPEPCG